MLFAMKRSALLIAMIATGASVCAAVEEPIDSRFKPAKPDALTGAGRGLLDL
jgi:hypothetical protein